MWISGSDAEPGEGIERERGRLAMCVGRVVLGSPFLVAAGPWSAGEAQALPLTAELAAAGAVTSKTVTLFPRDGNPEPTVRPAAGGFINRVGLRNPGVAEFIRDRLPRLLELKVPILVSVAAQEPVELSELLALLEARTEPATVVGYELNASCPNLSGESPDPAQLSELVASARHQTARPLWVKLGYAERSVLRLRAQACAAAGADALVAINTIPAIVMSDGDAAAAPPVDQDLVPFLGGLSGSGLHPLALRAVWELTHAQPLPVIGCGGVHSIAQALAFFAVGAQAVQLGSVLYPEAHALSVLPSMYAELVRFLDERGLPSLATYLQEPK